MPDNRSSHPPPAASFEYRLQRSAVGVVLLDADRTIRSVNPVALRLLAPPGEKLFGVDILTLHPEEARDKVAWLIERAGSSADGTSSLVVTTAMGSLVAKVSRLERAPGGPIDGYCMMIHAFSEEPVMGGARPEEADTLAVEGLAVTSLPVTSLPVTSLAAANPAKDGAQAMAALCPLMKLPLVRGRGGLISLIDVAEVVCLVAQGHYAEARTLAFSAFCPRPLADLERRLDPSLFLRVHRRYLVNIRHVRAAAREDGAWHLVMADQAQTRVPVSRAKVEVIRRLLAV